ncbi:MAG: TetR family transcriptional regulator [Mycobacterium sp.]|nr:TetR family transcriptional regulator [Mycobacterium sp.]
MSQAIRTTRAERRRQTEERVLTQARRQFAELGYDRTTVRGVAAAADTDPALVMRYFGSKKGLFLAATTENGEPVGAAVGTDQPLGATSSLTAERMLTAITIKLETDPTPTLALLRSMLTNPNAAEGVRASIAEQQHTLSQAIDGPDAELRCALFGALSLGVLIGRYLLKLDGLNNASPEQITEVLRPCIRALTQP